MTAIDKARETAAKIKAEVEADKAKTAGEVEQVKNELATVSVGGMALQLDAATLQFMQENQGKGIENLGESFPTLKIFTSGKSQDLLADGTEPTNGWFYYTKTMEQSQTVLVHLLTISKGYRADGLEDDPKNPGHKKQIFNQIMGGVMFPDMMPFIMYMSGKKLQPMWDFADEIKVFTKNKACPIPMMLLQVKLSTEREKNDFGYSWVPKFELVKDAQNIPYIERDANNQRILAQMYEKISIVIDDIVNRRASENSENKGTGAWAGSIVKPAQSKEQLNEVFPPEEESYEVQAAREVFGK